MRNLTIVTLFILGCSLASHSTYSQSLLLGNDTIHLQLDNFHYGTLQWEESTDSLSWTPILGANDTVYTFFPEAERYYRAKLDVPGCSTEYSEVCHVLYYPTVINSGIANLSPSTADVYTSVLYDGGSPVMERGICWNTTGSPSLADTFTVDGSGLGAFITNLYGLSPNSLIYIRSYASNSVGTAYSDEVLLNTGVYYPSGTSHCDPFNATIIAEVVNPLTGRIWMDRNLGAAQVATDLVDTAAFGDLYQWGRFADGHQCRNSPLTSNLSSTDQPLDRKFFILSPLFPLDWRSPQNHSLWQGVNGINNPCPIGFRVPTGAEWTQERLSWSSNNEAGAFNSPLKLSLGGGRYGNNGTLGYVGASGGYWSSTIDAVGAFSQHFFVSNATLYSYKRSWGFSVRCIKD